MRKKMSNKILSVTLAAAMTMSLAACGSTDTTTTTPAAETPAAETPAAETPAADTAAETPAADETPAEEVSPYTILTDENGNTIDLGGMHIIVRDWWSSPQEASNDYEEARDEYREWIQETYNFTIEQTAISDWGSTPADFVDYVTTGGDDNNYVFIVRDDPAITSAMNTGLMYDLATLSALDFSDQKFQDNLLHTQYSKGDSIYCMYAGKSEARTGVYFNKRVLTEAGIDPDSIYEMQRNGTWTWAAFEEMMATCQRDTDNDGVDDVYGLTVNEGNMTSIAVYSNGSEFVGKDANGYVYKFEDPATLEALEWVVDMFTKFDQHDPEGANWDYYKEEFISGKVAFMVDDEYCATRGNFLCSEDSPMEDEIGFVMFPVGPQGKTYVNCWSNNPACIPACYDADRANKIAFAYNLFTDQPAGYEDYIDLSAARAGAFDQTACDETIPMMMSAEHGMITYHGLIPELTMGDGFLWAIGPNATISSIIEAKRDEFQAKINAANGN